MTLSEALNVAMNWLLQAMAVLGYPAVFAALFLEGSWIPITSEIFLLTAGFLAFKGEMNFLVAALSGAAGFAAGSLVPFFVARYKGRPFLERWGRYVFVTPEDVVRVENWFTRYGPTVILFTRMIPIVRNAISFPAGLARLRPFRFFLLTMIGFGPWAVFITYAGMKMGANWDTILRLIDGLSTVGWGIVGGFVLLGAMFLVHRYRIHRHRRRRAVAALGRTQGDQEEREAGIKGAVRDEHANRVGPADNGR